MHKILVIDDEVEIARILGTFLTKKGFEVFVFSDPEKAVQMFESDQELDLMVVDMKMPKLRGTEVLTALSKTERDLPVIILTGSIDATQYKEELEITGQSVDDIVYKPVDLAVILSKIHEKLGIEE